MKKTIIATLALLAVSSAVYAEMTVKEKWNELSGKRFDFFDESGNRVRSSYYSSSGPVLFNSYQYYTDPDQGFTVSNGYGIQFKSIKTVPWGDNSYPIEITSQNEDLSVAFTTALEDTDGDGNIDYDDIDFSKISLPKAKRAPVMQQEMKCGADFLISMDIPEGTYPVFETNQEYTFQNSGEEPYYASTELPVFDLFYNCNQWFSNSWLLAPQYRKGMMDYYKTNGMWYPDPTVRNRWHILYYMPNEPMNIRISYKRLGDKDIESMIKIAASAVYSQKGNYQDVQAPFFNGEPWLMAKCGESFSQDCINTMIATSNQIFVNPEFYSTANYWMPHIPWGYCYGLIETANSQLYLLDHLNFSSATRVDEARAVMRALRGNAYMRLLQLYAPRWEDSNNGATLVAPLCTEWGNLDLPASSMAEIRDFAKADLEFAIEHLEDKTYSLTTVPNADVARGLLIRLSMLCHDWQTVNQQSQILLDKYPLTTNEEMRAGFFKRTGSWIWTASEMPEAGLYYWSFASSCAVNGTYPLFWNNGSAIGCIDRDLFLQIPENDIRRLLFAMPEHAGNNSVITRYFFDNSSVDATTLLLSGLPRTFTQKFVQDNMPDSVDDGSYSWDNTEQSWKNTNFYFGTQVKFWGGTTREYNNTDQVCLMRTEEILLSRAEALMEMGDEMGALHLLNQLNSMRNPEGPMSVSKGTALRDEIRLARRIELWGEGHSFFDFKRWNLPVKRRGWYDGDTSSSNWPLATVGTFNPSDYNGWRYVIPVAEVNANKQLDIKALGYQTLKGYGEGIDNVPSESGRSLNPALQAPAIQVKGRPGKFNPADSYKTLVPLKR